MFTLYQNEWLKLRRQFIWMIILFVPFIGVCLGTFSFTASYDLLVDGGNEWYAFWTQITFFYGLFIYPILSGIFAAIICRNEHLHGGWKHQLSLPLSRTKVFLAKLFLVYSLLFLTQLILLLTALAVGLQVTAQTNPPLLFLIGAVTAGWVASFPLTIIQLWISINIRSFVVPLGINLFFVFGSLAAMVMGIEKLYPWAHPSIAMASPEEANSTLEDLSIFTVSYLVVLVTYCVCRFNRKEMI